MRPARDSLLVGMARGAVVPAVLAAITLVIPLSGAGCTSKSTFQETGDGGSAGGGAGGTTDTGVAGGAAGLAGQGGSAPGHDCESGDVGCSGETPVKCSDEGRWIAGSAVCAFSCAEGACTECVDATRRCLRGSAQVCVNGAWTTESTCAAACEAGECVDACEEGRRQCDGTLVLQVCDGGVYVDYEECDFLCQGDVCTGLCVPNSVRCDPSAQNSAQRCDANGRWSESADCTGGSFCVAGTCKPCRPGAHRCEVATPQECSDAGDWVDQDSCDAGTECDPASAECVASTCVFGINTFGDGSVFAP